MTVHEIANQARDALAQQQDTILQTAINLRMGRADWSMHEVAYRGHVIYQGHDGALEFFFDGTLLVRFGPISFPEEHGKLTFSQPYEIIYP